MFGQERLCRENKGGHLSPNISHLLAFKPYAVILQTYDPKLCHTCDTRLHLGLHTCIGKACKVVFSLCRYPNNPVLKVLTPQGTCRKLDIFPVKMTQDAISVDVSGVSDSSFVPQGKGGADSSIDLNNVFAEEQRPYYEGQNPESKLLMLHSVFFLVVIVAYR